MPTEFILPELGENITSADVVEVLVSEGDTIAIDDSILEIETDKATFEVPSTVAGVVKEIRVKAGESAAVGQVVLVVEESETAETSSDETDDAPAAATDEPSQDSKEEKNSSDEAEAAQKESSVKTAVAPVESRGRVQVDQDQTVATEEPSVNGTSSGPRELAPAAPSTRRLAREIGVDIHQVKGSGASGRISVEDVKAFAKGLLAGSSGAKGTPGAVTASVQSVAVPLPDFSSFGTVRREKMSNVRRKTAEQMHRAWSTIPQVTQFDKSDITDLEALRKKINGQAKPGQAKLTVTAILLKIMGSALKKFPQFNASVDMANEEIVYKDYFNVGVAVDTERGLLVPVVRDVTQKNIVELAGDLNELAEKAREKKIRPDDMSGACITITNLGGIGGHAFTPIVNPPEVAILGVSRASMEPVYQDDTFYARLMMPVCLTYDHRLIDGADAARFLRWVCEALENPALVAFEG